MPDFFATWGSVPSITASTRFMASTMFSELTTNDQLSSSSTTEASASFIVAAISLLSSY
jgi:hypothetical protein